MRNVKYGSAIMKSMLYCFDRVVAGTQVFCVPGRRMEVYFRISDKKGSVMSREEVFETLNEVFRDVFDDETITVNDDTTADDIEDWDSLEHINLMAAVESEFGIKFSMGQIMTMKNVGEMADIILQKI